MKKKKQPMIPQRGARNRLKACSKGKQCGGGKNRLLTIKKRTSQITSAVCLTGTTSEQKKSIYAWPRVSSLKKRRRKQWMRSQRVARGDREGTKREESKDTKSSLGRVCQCSPQKEKSNR